MSTEASRNTRNAVRVPGRRLIWVICPSTQMLPSRSIHWATFAATERTGYGCSAELAGAPVCATPS